MANLLRALYAPLFFFGLIASACWLTEQQRAPLWILIALLMLAIAISFITEWKLPFDGEWNQNQGDGLRDSLHAVTNESLNCLSITRCSSSTPRNPDTHQ